MVPTVCDVGGHSNVRQMGRRVRRAFQADALFEVVCGSVLMANVLVGPDLGVNGYLVSAAGLLLMIVAILLGGAGLGKGPLANRLAPLSLVNAACGVGALAWAVLGNHEGAALVLLLLIGVGLIGIAALQQDALRRPDAAQRIATTQAEMHAALRGEHPKRS